MTTIPTTIQFRFPRLSALALLLLLAGCRDSARESDSNAPDVETSRARVDTNRPAPQSTPPSPIVRTGQEDDLFSPPRVFTLEIEITDAEQANMNQSHQYGRCTVREGGRALSDVGIRYKGNPTKEAASGKPDFNLEFNEFLSGQTFHGLKRLILLAGRNDPSYLSAPLGLELFRRAGVPAARCGFARMQLNGHDLGLYLLVEGVDRTFLRRHFAKSSGNLYDEGDRTDVDGKLEKYGERNNVAQPDVDALAEAAKQTDPAQRWAQLERVLAMDRFISFTAVEVLLWLEDSYALEARKFRIYHDPATDRMVFFPKNVEEIFDKTDGLLIPEWRGLVARAALTTPQGREKYCKTVAQLLDAEFKSENLVARARELATLIRPVLTGTGAESAKQFDAAVDQFCARMVRRVESVSNQLQAQLASGGQ